MFLGDSISCAVSELWQLAMTLATLKYIAGMVRQDLEIGASTGQEEDNKQSTESHRPSHVDKKEAHSDTSFAKNEEIEPAAFISSVVSHSLPFQDTSTEPEETQFNTSMVAHYQSNTEVNCVEHEDDVLSMVCHHTPIHFHVKKYQADSMVPHVTDCNENEEIEQTFLPSMVTHQLATVATPVELSEIPVSMSAHGIVKNGEEDGDNMIETSQKISMMVHQITIEDISNEQDVTVYLNNFIIEDINYLKETVTEENDVEEICVTNQIVDDRHLSQTEACFTPSMYTHQLSQLETAIEMPEYQVTMAVHRCYNCTIDDEDMELNGGVAIDPGMISSMVSHQVFIEDKSTQNQFTEDLKGTNLELSETIAYQSVNTNQISLTSSMIAHQLPLSETPIEFAEPLVSSASYGCLSLKDENNKEDTVYETDPGMLCSMMSHQFVMEEKSIETHFTEEFHENNVELTKTIDCQSVNTNQISFPSSMIAHQLPLSEIPTEFAEPLVSSASYGCLSSKDENNKEDIIYENYPGMLCSMVSHQFVLERKSKDNILSKDLTDTILESSETIENESVDINHLTMIAHQLPFCEASYGCLSFKDNIIEECAYETDPGMLGCMVSHQVVIEEKSEDNLLAEDLTDSILVLSEPIDNDSVNINQLIIPSTMIAHQLPFSETPTKFAELLVSTASHGCLSLKDEIIIEDCIYETDPGKLYSMLSHQVSMENKSKENIFKEDLNEQNLELSETINHGSFDINEVPVPSSMVAHQLPLLETPTEFSEFLVSTACHGYLSFKGNYIIEDSGFETDPGGICSMVSHQADIKEKSAENLFTEDLTENILELSKSIDYESVYINQYSSSMAHQLPFLETPTEFSEALVSTASHGCSSLKDDNNKEDSAFETDPGILCSMVSHQVVLEDKSIETTFTEDLTENNLDSSKNIGFGKVDINQLAPPSSMIAHQLSLIEIPTDFAEPLVSTASYGCLSSEECWVSMITHIAPSDSGDDDMLDDDDNFQTIVEHSCDISSVIQDQIPNQIITMEEDIIEYHKLIDNTCKVDNQMNINRKYLAQQKDNVSNKCQDQRPVGMEGIEEMSESFDIFMQEADSTYSDTTITNNIPKPARIQELQRVTNDEIGELENKQTNDPIITINNVDTTETLIESNVNDDIFADESISSETEMINSVISTTSDKLKYHDEQNDYKNTFSSPSTSQLNTSVDNLVHASCNIEDNSPVIITTNQVQINYLDFQDESTTEDMEKESGQEVNDEYKIGQNLQSDNQQEENENDNKFIDWKMHPNKMPCKSCNQMQIVPSNVETKIRETELLNSLQKTVDTKEHEKYLKKGTEKEEKTMTIATLNENVKKQTYKIRFKVKLNADSSKSSILKYLCGCFGGEKLFKQPQ